MGTGSDKIYRNTHGKYGAEPEQYAKLEASSLDHHFNIVSNNTKKTRRFKLLPTTKFQLRK